MASFVTDRTHGHAPSDAGRERLRLWAEQRLFAAAWAASAIGTAWLAVRLGGGASGAAAAGGAGRAPLARGAPLAARLAARVDRRALLWGSQAAAAAALVACVVAAPWAGPAAAVAGATLVGAARAVIDAATTDVLQHLTEPERRRDACRDLTARFGAGHAAGVAGALVVGLAAGPDGALLLAAAVAAAGAGVAGRHHPDLDLRVPEAPPAHRAFVAALRHVAADRTLRGTLLAGAWATAVGAAQGSVLIAWLSGDVGLRGALVPALLVGFGAVRLARPFIVEAASRRRLGTALAAALAAQAAASLAAYSADGSLGAASAYGLGLVAAVALGVVMTRALRVAAPPELAPAVGQAAGAAWALAACAGAGLAAGLAFGVGLAETHLVLAGLALAGTTALTAYATIRRPQEGSPAA
jgi:predicted MFS family arabinose efflux permease